MATVLTTLLAATVSHSVLPAADAVTAASSQRAESYLTPSDPIAGEFVTWAGQTTLPKARVSVEAATAKGWKEIATLRTDRAGRFTASLRAGKAGMVYRYRISRDGRTLARRKIVPVEQTVVLGDAVGLGGMQIKLTATFTPIRKGRRAGLLTFNGTQWGLYEGGTQNAAGQVTWTLLCHPQGSATFRADAYARNGADFASSNSQTVAAPICH